MRSLHPTDLEQVVRGHALEHRRGRDLIVDPGRDLHQHRCEDVACLGVGADGTGRIADAVADSEAGHPLAERLDRRRPLPSRSPRERDRVEAGAVIRVDEVETNRRVLDADLAWPGRRELDGLPAKDIRPADFVNAHGVDTAHRAELRIDRDAPQVVQEGCDAAPLRMPARLF